MWSTKGREDINSIKLILTIASLITWKTLSTKITLAIIFTFFVVPLFNNWNFEGNHNKPQAFAPEHHHFDQNEIIACSATMGWLVHSRSHMVHTFFGAHARNAQALVLLLCSGIGDCHTAFIGTAWMMNRYPLQYMTNRN